MLRELSDGDAAGEAFVGAAAAGMAAAGNEVVGDAAASTASASGAGWIDGGAIDGQSNCVWRGERPRRTASGEDVMWSACLRIRGLCPFLYLACLVHGAHRCGCGRNVRRGEELVDERGLHRGWRA